MKIKKYGNSGQIDKSALEAMMQFKVTKEFVADYFGVSISTLFRYIRDEYEMTFRELNDLKVQKIGLQLQQKIIQEALKGNTAALIFSLKNISKWTDKIESTVQHEIKEDEDEAPVELDYEERLEMLEKYKQTILKKQKKKKVIDVTPKEKDSDN